MTKPEHEQEHDDDTELDALVIGGLGAFVVFCIAAIVYAVYSLWS